jgi:hypothetical protein
VLTHTYELEVNEDDGTTTQATISTPYWCVLKLGDVFDHEGRALRIWRIEELDSPDKNRLVCDIADRDGFAVGLPVLPALTAPPAPPEERVTVVESLVSLESLEAMARERRRMRERMAIRVSPDAAERIRSKGGNLYLWQGPFGAFLVDKARFERPDEVSVPFDTFNANGVRVLIASDVELPEQLSIEHSLFPPLKLKIAWDGDPWGHRGDASAWS